MEQDGYTRPRAYIIIFRVFTLCFLYSNIRLLFEKHFKFTFTFTFGYYYVMENVYYFFFSKYRIISLVI